MRSRGPDKGAITRDSGVGWGPLGRRGRSCVPHSLHPSATQSRQRLGIKSCPKLEKFLHVVHEILRGLRKSPRAQISHL